MNVFNKTIATLLPFIPKPILWQFSKKYIAGASMEAAISTTQSLNDARICATLDVLGEDTINREDAHKATQLYHKLLDVIQSSDVDSGVSLKPTQLGLRLDRQYCYENIGSIVEKAESFGRFVRIDMEDHTCTTETLDIYYLLKKNHQNVGIVVQACLRRTLDDVRRLVSEKGNVRLCKGVYIEPEEIAYCDRQGVRDNFLLLLEELLKGGCYVGIATHDNYLVDGSYKIIRKLESKNSDYEFQMLLGVTQNLRQSILDKGDRMRVYVPFGEEWRAYCIRRLKENPTVAGYVAKGVFTFRRSGPATRHQGRYNKPDSESD
ncbi:proline dehydrogenase [candidate division TA06 bacterium]|uniref:proline dehydrogenase n=1 Tax=candidate division TA06 bacterium TaxID=2250710 RepID=A0A523XGD3_UNCT6|nr:MAG: proline dehydrogenase [candidate division TA06 bacterium]